MKKLLIITLLFTSCTKQSLITEQMQAEYKDIFLDVPRKELHYPLIVLHQSEQTLLPGKKQTAAGTLWVVRDQVDSIKYVYGSNLKAYKYQEGD